MSHPKTKQNKKKQIKWPEQRIKENDMTTIQKIAKKTIPLSQIETLRVWSGVGAFDYGCDTRSLSTKQCSGFKVGRGGGVILVMNNNLVYNNSLQIFTSPTTI